MNSSKNNNNQRSGQPKYSWAYPDTPPDKLRTPQRQPTDFVQGAHANAPADKRGASSVRKPVIPRSTAAQPGGYIRSDAVHQTAPPRYMNQNRTNPDSQGMYNRQAPQNQKDAYNRKAPPTQQNSPNSQIPRFIPPNQQSTPSSQIPRFIPTNQQSAQIRKMPPNQQDAHVRKAPPIQQNTNNRHNPQVPQNKTVSEKNTVKNQKVNKSSSKKRRGKKSSPSLRGIEDHTPSSRKQSREFEKLDPERLEIERRNREKQQYYLKKRREIFMRVLIKRFVLFLVVFSITLTSSAILLLMRFYNTKPVKKPDVTYEIGSMDAEAFSYSQAYNNGVMLVNFFDIANLCSMTISGSAEELKFSVLGDSGEEKEFARFIPGTDIVYMNGVMSRLSASSHFKSEELWIPLDFVTSCMYGLKVDISEEGSLIKINRVELNSSTPANPKYEAVSFALKETSVIKPIDESLIIGLESVKFVADLNAYEKYMNPAARNDYLLLVNTNNKLDESYVPPDLTDIAGTATATAAAKQLREYAAKALEAMLLEAQANGVKNLRVSSAYRSYAYQVNLFSYYVNTEMKNFSMSYAEAYAKVSLYSAPPGTSEHQTGLATDVTSQSTLDESFAQTAQYKWLSENAHKFGFVVRFPKGKTDKTGITFEPWHYRFVGRYHATRMYEKGLCLEEYVETLN